MSSSSLKADFSSHELDALFQRWLGGKFTPQEQNEWNRILTSDARFREKFCDWVKSLRDPAWANAANRQRGDS